MTGRRWPSLSSGGTAGRLSPLFPSSARWAGPGGSGVVEGEVLGRVIEHEGAPLGRVVPLADLRVGAGHVHDLGELFDRRDASEVLRPSRGEVEHLLDMVGQVAHAR